MTSVPKSCCAALSLGVALWGASSQAGTLTTLYSFENVDVTTTYDGASPVTGFFADGTGNLYGSTSAGGTSGNPDGIAGYGIEYELGSVNGTTIGSYVQTCNLTAADGYGTPMGDLVGLPSGSSSTILYGATSHLADPNYVNDGGPQDNGNIISCGVSAGSTPTLLGTFGASAMTDPQVPSGALTAESSGGTLTELYGTTRLGGSNNTGTIAGSNSTTTTTYFATGGTVYEFTPSATSGPGTITILHSFGGASVFGPAGSQADGVEPVGGVVSNSAGTPTLYGTTAAGGLYGFGTIFQCAPAILGGAICGNYSVLHNFGGPTDGMSPTAPLIYVSTGSTPALFGTTSNNGSLGGGTVFELTLPSSGTDVFTTLLSFTASSGALSANGANPSGDLAFRANTLYGTTWQGGDSTKETFGSGTIYKCLVSPGVSCSVEYRFMGPVDGQNPFGGLLMLESSSGSYYLYGTTHDGGCATGTIGNGGTSCTPTGTPGSGTIFTYSLP